MKEKKEKGKNWHWITGLKGMGTNCLISKAVAVKYPWGQKSRTLRKTWVTERITVPKDSHILVAGTYG